MTYDATTIDVALRDEAVEVCRPVDANARRRPDLSNQRRAGSSLVRWACRSDNRTSVGA
jgi:hypothetical protein